MLNQQIPSIDLFSSLLLIMSSQAKIPKHLRKASYKQKKTKQNKKPTTHRIQRLLEEQKIIVLRKLSQIVER